MKALTVDIPFAPMIAFKEKGYETHPYPTSFRGDFIIHASKNKRGIKYLERELRVAEMMGFIEEPSLLFYTSEFIKAHPEVDIYKLYGKALCVATLVDCIPCHEVKDLSNKERTLGYWKPLNYAWKLENIRLLPEFVSVKGLQRLWNIDPILVGLES